MQTIPKRYVLADVESVQSEETGDRVKRVVRAQALVGLVDVVGVNTAQLGQVQGFTLAYSVQVLRALYKKEKFLYFDGALYEIKTLGKAKSPAYLLLNVQEASDPEIKRAIEEWQDENL